MTTTVQHAIVKSIYSGDTIVIKPLEQTLSNNENEQRISLNHIVAPKLARSPNDSNNNESTDDEPYAFQAREYLRKKLVGQQISYRIDFQIPKTNRFICTVYLGKNIETGENIIESLLSEGLVELRQQKGVRAQDIQFQKLKQIDQQAKQNKRGRYSDDLPTNHIRNIKWTLENPKLFFEQHKFSPPLDAIVEYIRDGNTARCLFLPSFYFVTIQLTGIRCPMLKRDDNPIDEPFAEEAKQYVETRLLQREVKVILNGVHNQNLVATLLHPNGNIVLYLLREGLARCIDWSLAFLPQNWREQYRTAEKYAKDNCLRIWKNHISSENVNNNQIIKDDPTAKEYQGKVLEIINADSLVIRDLRDNRDRRIYFSSVRPPRVADFQDKTNENNSNKNLQQIKRPLYELPFVLEARELLRKSLIGKTVRILTDYIQPATNEYPERICCTVYLENVNIGEALISRGLAKATRHRRDDEQRSSCYENLLNAEQQAEKRSIGLFSTCRRPPGIIDLTDEKNKERIKGLEKIFKRKGRMEGVVEFVGSGSRFRIYLVTENWIISFLLSSINCPRIERRFTTIGKSQQQKVEPSEPFAVEAFDFSKKHFLQRDVFIEVESVDRGGNFIGQLTTTDGESAALMLVQAGLAKVNDSAYNSPNYEKLLKAEEESRKNCIGLWTISNETLENERFENENSLEFDIINFAEPTSRHALLTFVTSDLKIYIQYSDQGEILEKLQNDLREFFNEKKPVGEHKPRKGELLAARFSADNQWYRARVERVATHYRTTVFFIDYGNREIITDLTQLTKLPPGFSQLPAQASEFEIAYSKLPFDEDDRQITKNALINEIGNDEILVKVEYRLNNINFISIHRINTNENIIETLAKQGLIVIGQVSDNYRVRSTPLYEQLEQAQSKAKAEHRGFWRNSDEIKNDAKQF